MRNIQSISKMKRGESVSESKSGEGTSQPETIVNLADSKSKKTATRIGFMYRGGEYGEHSAWITCKLEDMKKIRL